MLLNTLLVLFFLTVTSVTIVCMCLDMFIKHRFLKKYAKNLPVLPYLPIVGNAHSLIGHDMLAILSGWRKKIQVPFFYWVFHLPHYFTNDPKEIKEILTNPNTLEKGFAYKFLKPGFGNSLLNAEVSIWKKNRRIISKTFTQKALENSVPIIDKMCDKLIDKIRTGYNGNCLETIERFNVDTFAETLCNIRLDEVAFDVSKFNDWDLYTCMKRGQHCVIHRFLRPWYYPDIVFFNSKMGKELDRINKQLDSTLNDAIEDRKKTLKEEKAASAPTSNFVIDVMIEGYMTNEDMIGELKFLGVASAETSGTTLAITLNLLAIYPDIQEKVLKEVIEVIGPDGPVKYKDIVNLKYTEMVLQETLRIFPPGAYLFRTTSTDVDIGGKLLPKGTNITIDAFGVHRSEKYWRDPLKFNPDRFLPSEIDKRQPFTFLPFSLGPRNCIGIKYAMIVMKTTLAKLIRSYNVTSNIKSIENLETRVDVTLRVENLDCVFTPRQ